MFFLLACRRVQRQGESTRGKMVGNDVSPPQVFICAAESLIVLFSLVGHPGLLLEIIVASIPSLGKPTVGA